MNAIALEMQHVYKKFRRGQLHDSLRDFVPALTRQLFGLGARGDLKGKEFWALRDVSFQVRRGEAFGVIGRNGAGKSTMLKLLSGIMRPTQGTMSVHGRLSALIEVSAGFHGDLTGRENIFLNGTIIGMTRQEIARRFDEIVAFSGLEEFIDTPVKRYSSGMYARLGFSVAAHMDPDILIVDEVLSVGDFVFQQKCIDRMTSVIKGGATVIFVSHNLKAVADLCSRAMLLDHGQVVTVNKTEEVIREYLSRVETRQPPKTGVFATSVDVRDSAGRPRVHFQSGDRAVVDVNVVSRGGFDRLAVVVGFKDPRDYNIFNVSSESLMGAPFTLGPNESITCSFEMDMHLAPGRYRLCTWIYRYDTQTQYDHWEAAATLFVSHADDVRGVVNLYPKVRLSEKRDAPPEPIAEPRTAAAPALAGGSGVR